MLCSRQALRLLWPTKHHLCNESCDGAQCMQERRARSFWCRAWGVLGHQLLQ